MDYDLVINDGATTRSYTFLRGFLRPESATTVELADGAYIAQVEVVPVDEKPEGEGSLGG